MADRALKGKAVPGSGHNQSLVCQEAVEQFMRNNPDKLYDANMIRQSIYRTNGSQWKNSTSIRQALKHLARQGIVRQVDRSRWTLSSRTQVSLEKIDSGSPLYKELKQINSTLKSILKVLRETQ